LIAYHYGDGRLSGGRPRSKEKRVKVSVTIPQQEFDWLLAMVKQRTFSTVSHGIEMALIEGRLKYGNPKGK